MKTVKSLKLDHLRKFALTEKKIELEAEKLFSSEQGIKSMVAVYSFGLRCKWVLEASAFLPNTIIPNFSMNGKWTVTFRYRNVRCFDVTNSTHNVFF